MDIQAKCGLIILLSVPTLECFGFLLRGKKKKKSSPKFSGLKLPKARRNGEGVCDRNTTGLT